MGYRYSKQVSRLEPIPTFKSGGWFVDVHYGYNKRDTSVVESSETGVIDTLSVDLRVPNNELLLPSSFTADTSFGKLVSLNGKVVKQSEATSLTAPAFTTINSLTKRLALSQWSLASPDNYFKITSLASRVTSLPVDNLAFRIPVVPVKPESVQILATLDADSGGTELNLRFNKQGIIDTDLVQGVINYQTGLVTLRFVKKIDLTGTDKGSKLASGTSGTTYNSSSDRAYSRSSQYSYNRTYEYWGIEHKGDLYMGTPTHVELGGSRIYGYEPLTALAETIRYNAIGYTYIPLDKEILGVDTVKLPPSGKVPAYRRGDLILVKCDKTFPLLDVTPEVPINIGATRLSRLEVVDALGVKLPFETYDTDLDAGVLTLKTGFPSLSYQSPFAANYQYQDMAVAGEVLISGDIRLTKPLTHTYSPEDTLVSSAILMGTMQARVFNVFTQETWRGDFLSYRVGEDSVFKYDTSVATIVVTNDSCVKEEWVLVFRSATSFDLIGKSMGKIATGTIAEDFTPLNPVTKKPLFHMPKEGFSSGAVSGNALRFNTNGANYPLWLVRTVLQSEPTALSHDFSIEFKGNKDRPA